MSKQSETEKSQIGDAATTGIPNRSVTNVDQDDVVNIQSLGDGYKITSIKAVSFDEKICKHLVQCKNFIAERQLKDVHINDLATQMVQRTFKYEDVNLSTCFLNGVEYRVNGQHTCWALDSALLNPGFAAWYAKACPKVRFIQYEAKSEADLRILYASTDRAQGRTKLVAIRSQLYGSEGMESISKKQIDRLSQGIVPWIRGSFGSNTRMKTDDIVYQMKTTHNKLVKSVAPLLAKKCSHIERSPVVAAMFETVSASASDSVAFWNSVRDGVDLQADSPILKLRNKLMQVRIVCHGIAGAENIPEDVYRLCIACWNAWRKGKTAGAVKVKKAGSREHAQ